MEPYRFAAVRANTRVWSRYLAGISLLGAGIQYRNGLSRFEGRFRRTGYVRIYIGAWSDNVAFIRMMERIAYRPNGDYRQILGVECPRDQRMVFFREQWQSRQPAQCALITISGRAECRDLFRL
jgi:hypothetical protein